MSNYKKEKNYLQAHKRLVHAIKNLSQVQNINNPKRNEVRANQNEFSLLKSKKNTVQPSEASGEINTQAVKVTDIVNVLNNCEKHYNTGKLLKSVKVSKHVLKRPTEKPTAELQKRSLGYENVKKKLMKWDGVVSKNRSSESQVFPLLPSETVYLDTSAHVKSRQHCFSSDLMNKMFATDEKLKVFQENRAESVVADRRRADENLLNSRKSTHEELIQRRKELNYLKIKQLQNQLKSRKKNKVKSKRYHKILKREKMKRESKDFEILQKLNPEEALEKLNEIERNRVYERASLRHKNTGTWAKNLQMRAKYDRTVRKELAEQLNISREMTQKSKRSIDDDYDDLIEYNKNNELTSTETEIENNSHNPWIKVKEGIKTDKNEAHEERKIREYCVENNSKFYNNTMKSPSKCNDNLIYKNDCLLEKSNKHKFNSLSFSSKKQLDGIFDKKEEKLTNNIQKKKRREINEKTYQQKNQLNSEKNSLIMPFKEMSGCIDHLNELKNLNFKNSKVKRPVVDEQPNGTISQNFEVRKQQIVFEGSKQKTIKKKSELDNESIDMTKLASFNIQKYNEGLNDLNFIVDEGTFVDSYNDVKRSQNDQQITINQVFEDDDIIVDFREEKREHENDVQNSEVNLAMPGWGTWAGDGLKEKELKENARKNRLLLQFRKKTKRADVNKNYVYINEESSKELRSHLVSDLPFPFKRVKDFEASINSSIGRSFVPETAFRLVTRPSIRTRKGQIIEPMDYNEIFKKPQSLQHIVDKRIASTLN